MYFLILSSLKNRSSYRKGISYNNYIKHEKHVLEIPCVFRKRRFVNDIFILDILLDSVYYFKFSQFFTILDEINHR